MRFALLALAALSAPAFAAPPPPTVEIRVRAINDLLGTLEYVGGVVNQEEPAKQLATIVRTFAGPKGLEGIDTKKPIGAYAVITKNVVDSPVVVLIPVADKETLLNALNVRLDLDPKKADDGVYEVQLKNTPDPVFFTFADDYLYVTYKAKKPLEKEERIAPKAFFEKEETALVSVSVHIDRVPEDVRKMIFGQFEHQMAMEKDKKNPGDTPAAHKLKGLLVDGVVAAVSGLFTDGRTLTAKLGANPEKDEIDLTTTLTAASGSDLKAAFAAAAGRKSVAPLAALGAKPALTVAANFGLPAGYVAKLGPVIDELVKDGVAAAKPEERDYAKKVFDAVVPTLKAGVVEFGGGFFGTGEPGKFSGKAAMAVAGGKDLEEAVKTIAPFAPADKAKFTFDVAKVGPANLHAVEIFGTPSKKLFGTETLQLATGENLLGVSIGEVGDAGFAAFKATDPKAGPLFAAEVGTVAATYLFEAKLKPATIKALAADTFGDKSPEGLDRLSLTVTGGDQLGVSFKVKGRAVAFLAALDQARKQ